MKWRRLIGFGVTALVIAAAIGWWATTPDMAVRYAPPAPHADQMAHGRALVTAGACGSCHTPRDRPDLFLAGGPRMDTPFGKFHVPNITPHIGTGIGDWSERDFVRAMRNGVDPDGRHLYPIFPYRWYRNLSDADLATSNIDLSPRYDNNGQTIVGYDA